MSPQIRINATEAESLKPIEEGRYPARVAEIKNVEKGPKAHYLPAVCEITEGEFEGRRFTTNLPIEGKGAGILIAFINNALDQDYDVDEIDELDFDTDDLHGAEIGIIIKNEEYPPESGDFRSNIRSTYKLG